MQKGIALRALAPRHALRLSDWRLPAGVLVQSLDAHGQVQALPQLLVIVNTRGDGVVLGITGSRNTGLLMVMVEEALCWRIPSS